MFHPREGRRVIGEDIHDNVCRLEHQVAHRYTDVYDKRCKLKDVDVIEINFLLLGFQRLSTGWKDKASSFEICLVEAPDERMTLCPAAQPAVTRVQDRRDVGGTRDKEPDGTRPDVAVVVRSQEHSNKTNVRHGVVCIVNKAGVDVATRGIIEEQGCTGVFVVRGGPCVLEDGARVEWQAVLTRTNQWLKPRARSSLGII
jgi:hypothetical protein